MGTSRRKNICKKIIQERAYAKFKERMSENPDNNPKLEFYLENKGEWEPGIAAEYMK